MSLSGLLPLFAADPAVRSALSAAGAATLDLTAPPSVRPMVLGALATRLGGDGRTLLAVTATGREADELAASLGSLLGEHLVAVFPAWETLPHERLSPRSDTVGRRLAVLRRLAHPSTDDPAIGPLQVVVATVRSLLQPMVPGLGELEPVTVRAGDTVDLDDLVRRLVTYAYTRVDMVDSRGQLAVRGGILDVFPPTAAHPLRVELWGDEVEGVREFAVTDQRSLGDVAQGVWAPPCRELLLTDEVRARAKELAVTYPGLVDVLDPLADGTPVEGMEALAPVLVGDLVLLLDQLPSGAHVVLCDPEKIRTRAAELVATSQEFLAASWSAAAVGAATPIDLGAAAYKGLAQVRADAATMGVPWWSLTPFQSEEQLEDNTTVVAARAAETYRGDTERAFVDVAGWVRDGWRVLLVTGGHGPAQRLVELLRDHDVAAVLVDDLADEPVPGSVVVSCGSLEHGFVSPLLRAALLTETDLVGQRGSTKDLRRMPSKRRNAVDPLQLQPGDPVVHAQHGVGRYVQMMQRTVAGATREYLVIEYAPSKRGQPGDRLMVPTDSLDQVSRYVGGENPSLDKMGGGDWAKRKGRARKAVKEIAGELIRLYSARMAAPGHTFGPDTPWQRELEDAFPFVETPDQAGAIDDVKADMEKPQPMDRVICGDVGYGKTEIAVRAAFKAVQDGKQVAVLVPTTLLAQQHYTTFSERFAPFPVHVATVSRFTSAKQQAQAIAGITDGTVDVVIGTHRLLSAQTRFKDLGLVIVDEEQRFGVEHKEYLKQLRTAVDVLTMSATPIPRTLEMSLTGIREMSTILTPPEERHPILTFVGVYDPKQISAAIRRELLREGQVFYIHNRVESIDRAAARIREFVPEARVVTAHGQMGEGELEQIMVSFWEREIDVLVCTTIVESGLDVANANTLIVERADTLGLSQLHQLRGRVGRSRERGYAYFLYPPEKPMTETAVDRLATIAQNSDLGAGMAVAMKDLEIRGAGNLLGGEQSGTIAGVGFDLYIRMVGEAVADYRGDVPTDDLEVRIEMPVDAHLPHDYLPTERLRLEAYRSLAAATTDEQVDAIREELADRYGQLPEPAENLLAVARFRSLARAYGVTEVIKQGKSIRFARLELAESAQLRLTRLHPGSVYKPVTSTMLVPEPRPAGLGAQPLVGIALLEWAAAVLASVLGEPAQRPPATAEHS